MMRLEPGWSGGVRTEVKVNVLEAQVAGLPGGCGGRGGRQGETRQTHGGTEELIRTLLLKGRLTLLQNLGTT